MKKEWKIFLTAVMFLTRIRVPDTIDHNPEYLQKSPKYFPLIGWIVAGVSGLTFLVFNKYIDGDLAILASMIAGILTTGAFHEDGFADVCDAFGGGWTKEKILVIMKDSRLGTFGVIGLIAMLAAKFMLLKLLPAFTPSSLVISKNIFINYKIFLFLLVAAHASSRLMAVTVIQQYSYVTDEDVSKSKPLASKKLLWHEMLLAIVFTLLPFIFLPPAFLLTLIPVFITRSYLAVYFKKWIGGYTGDCLGAIQQVCEIIFYLSAIIIWIYT